jgi:hypothetical protein
MLTPPHLQPDHATKNEDQNDGHYLDTLAHSDALVVNGADSARPEGRHQSILP